MQYHQFGIQDQEVSHVVINGWYQQWLIRMLTALLGN